MRELLPGMLEVLILRTLTLGPMHGYGIAQHIQRLSRDALKIEEGSLYPALQRLRVKGWVADEWRDSSTGRRARFYRLSATGRRQLKEEVATFDRLLDAVRRVLRPA